MDQAFTVGTSMGITLNRLVADGGCRSGRELQPIDTALSVGDIHASGAATSLLRITCAYEPVASCGDRLD